MGQLEELLLTEIRLRFAKPAPRAGTIDYDSIDWVGEVGMERFGRRFGWNDSAGTIAQPSPYVQ